MPTIGRLDSHNTWISFWGALHDIADQVKLPFVLIDDLLRRMKYDQLLSYRDSAPMNDYIYEMTEVGRERGRRFSEACSYYGAAPVAMEDYIRSVKAQSLETQHPTVEELRRVQSHSDDVIC